MTTWEHPWNRWPPGNPCPCRMPTHMKLNSIKDNMNCWGKTISGKQGVAMSYLTNKKILLTGAAGGFGTQFVPQLLQKGAQLILADIDETMAASGAATVPAAPGKVIGCIGADLATPEGCAALHSKVKEKAGQTGAVLYGGFTPKGGQGGHPGHRKTKTARLSGLFCQSHLVDKQGLASDWAAADPGRWIGIGATPPPIRSHLPGST